MEFWDTSDVRISAAEKVIKIYGTIEQRKRINGINDNEFDTADTASRLPTFIDIPNKGKIEINKTCNTKQRYD